MRCTSASKSVSDSGSRQPARRIIASTTAPPMITAPAPNTAIPWSSRTGNESLKPAIRLAAPSADGQRGQRREQDPSQWCAAGIPGIVAYRSVRAITSRWISFVPS